MKRHHATQQGFAAIAAIFVVVVLAALGGFMLTFSNAQHLTSAQDLQGSRAYWAARAGLEWGIFNVTAAAPAACPASPSVLVVDTFNVTITCDAQIYQDQGGVAPPPNTTIFQLTAEAASAGAVGTAGRIERSVSASLER
ncbi:MAG: hypothetical protein A3F78_20655 [Burkholderiales bacterium RIFCSPLOWO2_12_FULL_61_40]|nr:MAG: hypothetical protein A3F78_20655 [Burkholderiales bacterium RIFCSPLOWO2_12_FULL_61_40]